MSEYNHATVAFIVFVVAIVAIFDVYQLAKNGYTATISYTLGKADKKWGIIGVLAGVLIGHLWFPNRADSDPEPRSVVESVSMHCPGGKPWQNGNALCYCEGDLTECFALANPVPAPAP